MDSEEEQEEEQEEECENTEQYIPNWDDEDSDTYESD